MGNTSEKRKHGEDSVYFNEQRNCWVAQYSSTVDGNRIRKSAIGQTEEAIDNLQITKRELFKSRILNQKTTRLTFGQMMDKLMTSLIGTVHYKTYRDYEYRVDVLKGSSMVEKRIDKLDIPQIQESVNQIASERCLCESTCGKMIMFIKRIFRYAIDSGEIGKNPVIKPQCLKIPVFATEIEDVQPLSKTELEACLKGMRGSPRLSPIVYCMLLAGLRIGEVLALNWDKFDFDTGQFGLIHINKAVKKYKVKMNGCTKSEYRLGPPKTKSSIRTVPMTEQLREQLLIWKGNQSFYAVDKIGLDLVFPKRNGTLQDYDSFNIGFNKYLAKIGLDYYLYHSRKFRHTFASYLVKKGIAVKTLQKLMGHAKAETTMQYYVNVDQDTMDYAVQQIDVALIDPSFTFANYEETKKRKNNALSKGKMVLFPQGSGFAEGKQKANEILKTI